MSRPAYWSSWADCLGIVQQRHPTVPPASCTLLTTNSLLPFGGVTCLRCTVGCNWLPRAQLEELEHGVRPEPVVWDADFDPGLLATVGSALPPPCPRELVEGSVRPRLSQSEQALFRSQGGPLSSVPYTCFPTSPLTRFDASLFRVLLLRRFWLSIPPASRFCRCGRLLDVLGHHRAACAQAGVLGRRVYALESAAARVTTNVMVWDLDLLPLHSERPQVGGGCRWSAPLPWRPDRAGYDVGLTLETGRDATHSLCRGRRCGIDAGPPSERANVP